MTTSPKIGIILSTIRPARFADKWTQWLVNLVGQRGDAEFEVVDLRDYPMPFDEAQSIMFAPLQDEVALRWSRKVAELDGYIFITGEYDYGMPAVVKNALDCAYPGDRKPATFVGYGGCGAARAVEQLRLILSELQLATLRHTIHINRIELVGMLMHGKTFADYSYLEGSIAAMLNDLVWWACVLKAGRQPRNLSSIHPMWPPQ